MSDDPDDFDLPSQNDEALLAQAKRDLKASDNHTSTWRREAREDYDFVAGWQWNTEDVAKLREEGRPSVVFNRMGPVFDAIHGYIVNNRKEMRVIPRGDDDGGVAEMLNGVADWARDGTDAEDEETDAALDMGIAGMGWIETRMSFEEDPEGQIVMERFDPGEAFWDHTATKRNLADRRWCARVRVFTRIEFDSKWPEWAERVGDGAAFVNIDTDAIATQHVSKRDDYDGPGAGDSPTDNGVRGKIQVVDYQWKESYTVHKTLDGATGQVLELTPEQFERMDTAAKENGIELTSAKVTRKRVWRAVIAGSHVLEKGPSPCEYSFTLSCMTGKRDRNTNTWYGIARGMKDPQRWANKWLSQVLHIINTNAKGGVMVETTAVDDPQDFETKWAKPDAVTWLKPGALSSGSAQIVPKPVAPYPEGIDRLMQYAVQSIPDVSGINMQFLGLVDRQQPASLEYQRRQAAVNILAPLFDSLRRYRKEQGRVLLEFIQKFIPADRMVRVSPAGASQAQFVEAAKLQTSLKFDVIVDDSAMAPNQKEQTWSVIREMLPVFGPQLASQPKIMSEVLKFSPLPTSVATKISGMIEEAANQPKQPSPDQQKVQAEIAGEQAKLQMQQQKAAMDAQLEQQKAGAMMQQRMAEAQANLQVKAMEGEQTMALARQQAMLEMELAQTKAANEIEIARTKAAADIEIKRMLANVDAEARREQPMVN